MVVVVECRLPAQCRGELSSVTVWYSWPIDLPGGSPPPLVRDEDLDRLEVEARTIIGRSTQGIVDDF